MARSAKGPGKAGCRPGAGYKEVQIEGWLATYEDLVYWVKVYMFYLLGRRED